LDSGGGYEEIADAIFPKVEERWLDHAAFNLLFKRYGGSGVGLSLTEIEEMPVDRIVWWCDKLEATLEAEARAIKSAQSSKAKP